MQLSRRGWFVEPAVQFHRVWSAMTWCSDQKLALFSFSQQKRQPEVVQSFPFRPFLVDEFISVRFFFVLTVGDRQKNRCLPFY